MFQFVKEMYGSFEVGVNNKAKGFAHGVERIFLCQMEMCITELELTRQYILHTCRLVLVNTDNAFQAFENIMKDVKGGKTAAREVIQEFAPSREVFGVVEAHNVWTTKVKQGEKAIAALEKSLGKKNTILMTWLLSREERMPLKQNLMDLEKVGLKQNLSFKSTLLSMMCC